MRSVASKGAPRLGLGGKIGLSVPRGRLSPPAGSVKPGLPAEETTRPQMTQMTAEDKKQERKGFFDFPICDHLRHLRTCSSPGSFPPGRPGGVDLLVLERF